MKSVCYFFGTGLGCAQRALALDKYMDLKEWDKYYYSRGNFGDLLKQRSLIQYEADVVLSDLVISKHNSDWASAGEFWGNIYSGEGWLKQKMSELVREFKKMPFDLYVTDASIFGSLLGRILKVPRVGVVQSCFHPDKTEPSIRFWKDMTEPENHTFLELINSILEEYGVPPLKSFNELFQGDINIIPGYPSFDALKNSTPDENFYSGPLVYETRQEQNEVNLNADVFCYTGRLHDNAGDSGMRILNLVIEMAKISDLSFLVSTGGEKDFQEARECVLKSGCNNISVYSYVPNKKAHESVKGVIHHGGHGSCMAQILHQKPALILPTHTERKYNALKMEKLGMAHVVNEGDFQGSVLALQDFLSSDGQKRIKDISCEIIGENSENFHINRESFQNHLKRVVTKEQVQC